MNEQVETQELELVSPFTWEFITSKDFINFINMERKRQGIFNRHIGKHIGLGENQVSKITAGKRGVSVDNLIKILRCLGYRLALTKIEYPDDPEGCWFPDDDELNEMNDRSDFFESI